MSISSDFLLPDIDDKRTKRIRDFLEYALYEFTLYTGWPQKSKLQTFVHIFAKC